MEVDAPEIEKILKLKPAVEEHVEETDRLKKAIELELTPEEAFIILRQRISAKAKEIADGFKNSARAGFEGHRYQMKLTLNFAGNLVLDSAITEKEALEALDLLSKGLRGKKTEYQEWEEEQRRKDGEKKTE